VTYTVKILLISFVTLSELRKTLTGSRKIEENNPYALGSRNVPLELHDGLISPKVMFHAIFLTEISVIVSNILYTTGINGK